MIRAAGLYMIALLATSLMRSLAPAAVLLLAVGFASIIFLTTGNSTVQIAAAPAYRGRVTALWSTAFVGSTPIGAPIIGAIGAASPALALVVGAAACGAAACTGVVVLRAGHRLTETRARTGPVPRGAEPDRGSSQRAFWVGEPRGLGPAGGRWGRGR
jgi:MFS family permease